MHIVVLVAALLVEKPPRTIARIPSTPQSGVRRPGCLLCIVRDVTLLSSLQIIVAMAKKTSDSKVSAHRAKGRSCRGPGPITITACSLQPNSVYVRRSTYYPRKT